MEINRNITLNEALVAGVRGAIGKLPDCNLLQKLLVARALGIDTRPIKKGLLGPEFIGYAMAEKNIINPKNKNIVAVYGAAGADTSNFLLATNARRAIFVDSSKLGVGYSIGGLRFIIRDEWDHIEEFAFLSTAHDYMKHKYQMGYAESYPSLLDDINRKIVLELKCIGVDRDSIRVTEYSELHGDIRFIWAYPGQDMQEYLVTYLLGVDISKPEKYPEALKKVLAKGIDMYYQRAAYHVPRYYEQFLPVIAGSIKERGFLATDDSIYENTVNDADVDVLLSREKQFAFTTRSEISSEELRCWEEIIYKRMVNRVKYSNNLSPGYGWRVNIRQRIG